MNASRFPVFPVLRPFLVGLKMTALLCPLLLRAEVGPPGESRPGIRSGPARDVAPDSRQQADAAPVRMDLSGLESATTVWNAEATAWEFDGSKSLVRLDPGIPARIGMRDFSIVLEARLDRQPGPTAYIIEQHRDFPWTGLFLAVEENQRLRFRLKDLPHCDVICDVREWVGDGRFHEILLHRQGTRLEMVLDGVSRVAQVKPEHVDLDIDYNGNPLMVGAHCLGDGAFFHGAIRRLALSIGEHFDDQKLAALADQPGADEVNRRVDNLIQRLREGNASARAAVLRELNALDLRGRRSLTRHLEDPDPEVRETLREVLGQ